MNFTTYGILQYESHIKTDFKNVAQTSLYVKNIKHTTRKKSAPT